MAVWRKIKKAIVRAMCGEGQYSSQLGIDSMKIKCSVLLKEFIVSEIYLKPLPL